MRSVNCAGIRNTERRCLSFFAKLPNFYAIRGCRTSEPRGGQARSKLSSFGALFTLELLDLVALALDRALLILDLTLLLLRGDFLIL